MKVTGSNSRIEATYNCDGLTEAQVDEVQMLFQDWIMESDTLNGPGNLKVNIVWEQGK